MVVWCGVEWVMRARQPRRSVVRAFRNNWPEQATTSLELGTHRRLRGSATAQAPQTALRPYSWRQTVSHCSSSAAYESPAPVLAQSQCQTRFPVSRVSVIPAQAQAQAHRESRQNCGPARPALCGLTYTRCWSCTYSWVTTVKNILNIPSLAVGHLSP